MWQSRRKYMNQWISSSLNQWNLEKTTLFIDNKPIKFGKSCSKNKNILVIFNDNRQDALIITISVYQL